MCTPRTIWPAPPGASCSLSTSISNCMSFVNPTGVRIAKFFGSSSRLMSTIFRNSMDIGPLLESRLAHSLGIRPCISALARWVQIFAPMPESNKDWSGRSFGWEADMNGRVVLANSIRAPLKTAISDLCRQCRPGCAASSLWRSFHGESLPKREDHMLRPLAVLAIVVVTSSGSPAAAQDSWPSKPITVIVPFGAGGSTDGLARIYSARLSARLGQQFVIENRVGAGSIIGITSLARAVPDGYTIGVGTAAGLANNPAIMKENLGYSADKDFAYLHLMA